MASVETPETYFQAFVRLRSHATGEWLAPPELRGKLVADADKSETNLTEYVIAVLAKRYGIRYVVTGRRTAPTKDAAELNLRIPLVLKTAIGARANTNGVSLQRQIIEDLSAHHELVPPALKRRRAA